jgi:hypothetical protein
VNYRSIVRDGINIRILDGVNFPTQLAVISSHLPSGRDRLIDRRGVFPSVDNLDR